MMLSNKRIYQGLFEIVKERGGRDMNAFKHFYSFEKSCFFHLK